MSSFLSNLRLKLTTAINNRGGLLFLLNIYLLSSCILPALSLIPYLIFPKETIYFMNGDKQTCASAISWVPIAGSGDALQSFLNGWAFFSKIGQIKRFTVIGNGLYGIVHFGSFIRLHFQYAYSNNVPLLIIYISSLIVLVPVVAWWGFISPPKDVSVVATSNVVEENNEEENHLMNGEEERGQQV
ncbi:hypothetical protein ABK040_015088 [Willaertia magna]